MADKILVAVFSASGVTKRVGEEIAKIAGADFYEIAPKEIYTSAEAAPIWRLLQVQVPGWRECASAEVFRKRIFRPGSMD